MDNVIIIISNILKIIYFVWAVIIILIKLIINVKIAIQDIINIMINVN